MVTPKGLCSGVMLGVGGSIPPQLTKRKVFFDLLAKGYGSEIEVARPKSPKKWHHVIVTINVVKL